MHINTKDAYNGFDEYNAKVTSRCKKGSFLELDSGERAFAYKFANLLPGTKVICSILKPASENNLMCVTISHVVEYVA